MKLTYSLQSTRAAMDASGEPKVRAQELSFWRCLKVSTAKRPGAPVRIQIFKSITRAQGVEEAAYNLDLAKSQMTAADISEAQRPTAETWEKINN